MAKHRLESLEKAGREWQSYMSADQSLQAWTLEGGFCAANFCGHRLPCYGEQKTADSGSSLHPSFRQQVLGQHGLHGLLKRVT